MADNQNAVKHGVFSRSKKVLKVRRRRVQYAVRQIYQDRDQGIEPLASLLSNVDRKLVARWVLAGDMVDAMATSLEEEEGTAGEKELGRWIDREARLATMLGFTPASRFAMRVDALQGDDLALRAAKLRTGGGD